MNGLRITRSALDLSKRLANLNIVSGQKLTPTVALPENDLTVKPQTSILAQLSLGKNQDLALTAQFWSKQCQTQPKIEINDFIIKTPIGRTCYDESTVIIPTKNPQISPMEDPVTNGQIIEKKAHRRLRIRKKKMKVHRRKRRWKKYWVLWRKKYASREKKREVEFRQKMIAKVNEAKKFDPQKYVDEYLEDMKYELIPKTYKGRRLPQWLVKELLEKDAKNEERERMNKTNLLTGEPLIRDGETVSQFLDRISESSRK